MAAQPEKFLICIGPAHSCSHNSVGHKMQRLCGYAYEFQWKGKRFVSFDLNIELVRFVPNWNVWVGEHHVRHSWKKKKLLRTKINWMRLHSSFFGVAVPHLASNVLYNFRIIGPFKQIAINTLSSRVTRCVNVAQKCLCKVVFSWQSCSRCTSIITIR